MTVTTVVSPYHHYHSGDIDWVLHVIFHSTSSQSTYQLRHTVKWETNKNEVITGIV